MAIISVRKVWKAYDELPVVHGIDLEVEDGALVTLVGPSGCGKSTLLRMIAGLEDISDGEIAIGERVVNDIPPKDRDIAMVFQNYALYPHKTVADNMGFSLQIRGFKKPQIAERVGEAARLLGLEGLLERYPRQLSGGQRQRVAMGRAIVRKPSVFLFDEPLSNLDAKLRVQMRSEIKALHQRLKTTTVYVTHDQIEAMTLADQIVVMQDGVIKQVGAPLDLYDRPANLFVAGFIGSPTMNFFEGSITDGVFMTERGAQLPLPDGLGPLPDEPLVYGIRPEHIALASQGLAASVELVEPTGPEIMIEADMSAHNIVAAFKERHQIQLGEQLHLLPDRGKAHLFSKADGRAVRRH